MSLTSCQLYKSTRKENDGQNTVQLAATPLAPISGKCPSNHKLTVDLLQNRGKQTTRQELLQASCSMARVQ